MTHCDPGIRPFGPPSLLQGAERLSRHHPHCPQKLAHVAVDGCLKVPEIEGKRGGKRAHVDVVDV